MDLEQLEALAVGPERADAIAQLIPGTQDYYFYHCLLHQQRGQLTDVEPLLETWVKRHGETDRVRQIRDRQALLEYSEQPAKSLEYIRRRLGFSFDHQREIAGAHTQHPTTLNQIEVSRHTFKKDALAHRNDLSGFTDRALSWLAQPGSLDPTRRRALLTRLSHPDYPELVELIAQDLADKRSGGFGSINVHQTLTRRQLDELLQRRPQLGGNSNFVQVYVSRLAPSPDVDWKNTDNVKRDYLDALWSYVSTLTDAFGSVKAHVLYHRLDFDYRHNVFDHGRLMTYLRLPRVSSTTSPKHLQAHRNNHAQLSADYRRYTQLPPIGDDSQLVRSYLAHFFREAEDFAAYDEYLKADFLERLFAETKILAGVGDAERWYTLLDNPSYYQQLKDRVDLELVPHNRRYFSIDEPVELEVDIKNVPVLVIKVFEINTLSYFLTAGREVGTSVDLDGLVANEEHTREFDHPLLELHREKFSFDSLDKAGTYVIELIGNGKSSRALIRKGTLRYIERIGAAGHVLTVLNEANQPLTDASVWLAGQEYSTNSDGVIRIPFSSHSHQTKILLRHGDTTTLESFHHRDETYEFSCGIYVDREQLIKDATAEVTIRPSLRLCGVAVKVDLVTETVLEISSTDRSGTSSSVTVPIALTDAAETTHTFKVPPNLHELSFTVRGEVRNITKQRDDNVVSGFDVTVNDIDSSERTAGLQLSKTSTGYVLFVLGKTGEVRASEAVNVNFWHRDFTVHRTVALQTDARGRIELGALADIAKIGASIGGGSQGAWDLERDSCQLPSILHSLVDATITLPDMAAASEADASDVVSLLECRGGGYLRQCNDAVQRRNGLLKITGLTAGDYHLFFHDDGRRIVVRVTHGKVTRGWALSERRLLQLRNPAPLQITSIDSNQHDVLVQLVNVSEKTRVHVFGTRYVPTCSVRSAFDGHRPDPSSIVVHKGLSHYVSGRDIGDEYRYILERKRANVFSGNMLERPSLLLNPWEVRGTSTALDEAEEGGAYAASAHRAMAEASAMAAQEHSRGDLIDSASDSNIDFLAQPAYVALNLRANADGVVQIPREQLTNVSLLRVVAVDAFNVVMRQHALDEVDTAANDLTLQDGLDAASHFIEKKQRTCLTRGAELRLDDIRTSTIEAYDTVAGAFGLLQTLSNNSTLIEFSFIATWPELPPADKRAKYSEYACHELNLFLYFKDRPFFEQVIEPYLQHKKHKTFLDDFLTGADLRSYLQPWAYGQLNVVERILLARRIEDERRPVGRHAKDRFDLLPPNADRDNQLFHAALGGSALDGGDALGFDSAKKEAKAQRSRKKKGAKRRGAGGPPPIPSAPRSPAPASMSQPTAKTMSMSLGGADDRAISAGLDMDMDVGMAADEELDDDYGAREETRRFYRKLDKTKEWAENNYYKRRITAQNADLVQVNQLWRDYAAHVASGVDQPFLSGNFVYATASFTEIMCALAVLDVPFVKGEHEVTFAEEVMTLRAGDRTVIFHKEIKPAEPSDTPIPVLVSQSYFRADDRYHWQDNERYEKYVTGEMLVHVVYVCQVVLTNPSSSPFKLDLLMQIPGGAMPVSNGFVTQGKHVHLQPHDTHQQEYAFYFPRTGEYEHFPVHVSRDETLVAVGASQPIEVVAELSSVDTESWSYVSQRADSKQVLAYLADNNIDRIDLNRIAWRMQDRDFYDKVLTQLTQRHVYQPLLWSYSIHHDDTARIRTTLEYSDPFLRGCGGALASPLVTIDAVRRKWYEHLEYAPLVNARAHRLGGSLKILNDGLSQQYQAFLHALTYEATPSAGQLLAAAYYLLLQDRIEDALVMFDRVTPSEIATTLQYDYVRGFIALYRGKPETTREVAELHKDHPVDRWRKRFRNMLAVLQEAEGAATTVVDDDDRLQEQTRLATTQATFDFDIEGQSVNVSFQNLHECVVNYYLMDIELLFSRQPFMQDQSDRFSIVRPNKTETIALPQDQHEFAFDLPAEYRSSNTIVELVASGIRRSAANYAHELLVQLVQQYGQLRVYQRGTNTPLAQTYIKVYARRHDGDTTFYKDGYTDLRGAFDYASLSTDELDHVERFAILIATSDNGAVIREAEPPAR